MVLEAVEAARLKTDEIFTETKQLEARVLKETKDLRKQVHAQSSLLRGTCWGTFTREGGLRSSRNARHI